MIQILSTTKSTEKLAQLKDGLESPASLPYDFLLWIILGLSIFIVLGTIWLWVRHRRYSSTLFMGLESTMDSKRINIILQRAVSRQAVCKMEIFDHRHHNIYRGKVTQVFAGYHLLMELSHLPPSNSDFDSFPAQLHLHFRPSLKEGMEHYQLSSHTLSLVIGEENGQQVARVAVAWPKSVISSQQRNFMRVEPQRELPLAIKVLTAPAPTSGQIPPEALDSLPAVGEGWAIDLSVAGIQFMIQGKHQFPEQQNLLVTMELSSGNSHMDPSSQPHHLHLLLEPLSSDFILANNYSATPTNSDCTVVRGKFCGRYSWSSSTQTWEQVNFSLENFKDLAHWIKEYQRFIMRNNDIANVAEINTLHSP